MHPLNYDQDRSHQKFLLALIEGKFIVSLNWLIKVFELTPKYQIPLEYDHLPCITEPTLIQQISPIEMKRKLTAKNRKELFINISFLFITTHTYNNSASIVRSASGSVSLIEINHINFKKKIDLLFSKFIKRIFP